MAERGGGRVREIKARGRREALRRPADLHLGLDLWTALVARLKSFARAEAGAGRLFPWVPVASGAGIAFYFTADHEPMLVVAAPLGIVLCVPAFLLRRQRYFPVLVLIAAAAAGFATATFGTAPALRCVAVRLCRDA
jgi:competence protein ComEC